MNHFISLERAIQMTTTFRESKDKVLAVDFKDLDILPTAETFDRAAFDKLLSQSGCQKLRIYYGMDAELRVHAIVVSVDSDDKDMLPSVASTVTSEEDDNVIVEVGQRCPPDCEPSSSLNP